MATERERERERERDSREKQTDNDNAMSGTWRIHWHSAVLSFLFFFSFQHYNLFTRAKYNNDLLRYRFLNSCPFLAFFFLANWHISFSVFFFFFLLRKLDYIGHIVLVFTRGSPTFTMASNIRFRFKKSSFFFCLPRLKVLCFTFTGYY